MTPGSSSRRTSAAPRTRARLHALVVAAVLASASVAEAQSLADRETARSLMDEGDKKRDAGDMKAALQKYKAADAIMTVPTTGIEVARAQAALGQLLEARETLGRLLHGPAKAGEPAPFAAARKAADALSSELGDRIPSIEVVIRNAAPDSPPEITVDGEPIPAAAARAPRKVNPGAHTVVVTAGSYDKKVEITVAEREEKTVTFDLADVPTPAAPEPPPPAPAEPSPAPRIMMYGGFGVGALGLAVGAVTGLMSLSKTSELKDVCPNNQCPPGSQEEIDAATSLGDVATAAFVVGGVGLGVGVVGLLLSNKAADAPPASAADARRPPRVRAVLGPSYAGIAGVF